MLNYQQIIFRLILSTILSGIIGLERESIRRPAGFRTHILVCVGSTLATLVGLYVFECIKYEAAIDPLRLSAQVISGIGFLGAGTIIKEGSSVKGLTTAASLWAVASIGIAVGSGFYIGSIITTIIIFIALIVFTKLEDSIKLRRNYIKLNIIGKNKPGLIGKIGIITGHYDANIENINLEITEKNIVVVEIIIKIKNKVDEFEIINEIINQEGIIEVSKKR